MGTISTTRLPATVFSHHFEQMFPLQRYCWGTVKQHSHPGTQHSQQEHLRHLQEHGQCCPRLLNCPTFFYFLLTGLLFSQSIKKIKRADRKGTESVTEEKFALFFSTEITITGCDTPYRIQVRPRVLVFLQYHIIVVI